MSGGSRLELRVGMLIVGGLAAVVVLILISDRFSFDDSYPVTAYLKNANGLSAGTPVTLSGIRIGKIESIRTVSDARGAVEIKLSINERYLLPVDVRLQVASSGIFGDAFLEFTGSGVTTETLAVDGTAEVTASPGFFDKASDQALKIMDSLAALLEPGTVAHAKRLVANAALLAEESAGLVKDLRAEVGTLRQAIGGIEGLTVDLRTTTHDLGLRVSKSMDGLDSAVVNLDQRTGALLTRSEAAIGVAIETLGSIDVAADEAAGVLRDNRPQVRDALLAVADISRRGSDLIAGLQAGQGVVGQLLVNQDLAKDLNDIAINLSLTAELVADRPEVLVFGNSNANLIALQSRRERLRLRRAFQEGFYRTPPVRVVEPVQIADPAPMQPPATVED